MRTIVTLSLLLLALSAVAMPPHSTVVQAVQQKHIPAPYYLQHHQELAARGVNSPSRVNLGTGELDETIFDSIVLLVDFSDHQATTNASSFDNLMYGGGNGTVADFYDECSYGDFTLTTQDMPSSIGWLRMPHNYAYYVDGQNGFGSYPHNAQKLTEDAVLAANPFVDFSQYDYDNDGYIDGLFVVHSGTGAELSGNSNDIWSHKWETNNPVLVDGVYASVYAMEPEFWYSPNDMTIGVFAHEMGHAVFGFPDLYDYDYDSQGLGGWSLMAGGSWNGNLGSSPAHPDAWCTVYAGFVNPINVTFDRINESIANVETSPVIYRLWTQGQAGNQYFLVENRRLLGYDSTLPSQGLLIYHCDDNQWGNDNQWYPGHTNQGHYQVAVEQADGLWELEHNNGADSGDPYPGSTSNHTFNYSSTPNSRSYNNQATQVAVENISNSAPTMTANLVVGVAGGPDYSITLTPFNSPIIIPYTGGSFSFSALLENTLNQTTVSNVWTEAILPNGNTYHIDTYSVTFHPGVDIWRPSVTQDVPAMAPAGSYQYVAKIGVYPGTVYASDSFPFSKSAVSATNEPVATGWRTTGFTGGEQGVADASAAAPPAEFRISDAWPNPFNAETSVTVSLPQTGNLTLELYNTLGQRLRVLANGPYPAGEQRFTINAAGLGSGIYFLRASHGPAAVSSKIVLMK